MSLPIANPIRTEYVSRADVMKEAEWQFDALDLRPVVRWLRARQPVIKRASTEESPDSARPAPAHISRFPSVSFKLGPGRVLDDTYFDTPDWRFYNAGISVRIRAADDKAEATLKGLKRSKRGLRVRREIQTPLKSARRADLVRSVSRLGEWVRALSGPAEPAPLFTVHSDRRLYVVLVNGDGVGEVVLDETQITYPKGKDPLRLQRVTVQVTSRAKETVRPFVEDLRRACRLSPTLASPFEAGLLTLDIAADILPDVGSTKIGAAPMMGELGYAVLRRAFLGMLSNEAGTRVGEDIEALHDMRVAIRRMRAAMLLFEPGLAARARSIRAELGWLADRLGEVRDLDIQMDNMATWSKQLGASDRSLLNNLVAAIARRRQTARRKLLRSLNSKRYQRMILRTADFLRRGPPKRRRASRTPALAAFPLLVEQRHASVLAAGSRIKPGSKAAAYHRLRIRCKRLRYAIENGRELYGSAASAYLEALVRVQDVLGIHQDACVATDHLRQLLDQRGRDLQPRVVFMMGRAAQRYEQTAAKHRKRLGKVYPQIAGKAWLRFSRAMEKGAANLDAAPWLPSPPEAQPPVQPEGETT